MSNKHKHVYLWKLPKNAEYTQMEPFENGVICFPTGLNKKDLYIKLTDIADKNIDDIYFAFRRGGTIWRVYRTGEEENEFDNLFSNAI